MYMRPFLVDHSDFELIVDWEPFLEYEMTHLNVFYVKPLTKPVNNENHMTLWYYYQWFIQKQQ